MKHFKLVNDSHLLMTNDTLRDSREEFDQRIESGRYNLLDDEEGKPAICLCSHNSDECWHAGRSIVGVAVKRK